MKKIRQPDDDRPVIAAADQLLDKLLPSAFEFFRDSRFRQSIDFEKQDQIEQDRIFNELEVSAISLCLFCLDQRESVVQFDDFHFWKEVRERIPVAFEEKMLSFGVDKENARLFKDLIEIRYNEYAEMMEVNSEHMDKEIKFQKIIDNRIKESITRVHSIVVGTSDHIRRGKLQKDDELMKHIRRWLLPLDSQINSFIKNL
ncbi:MAG: hypothetical protein PHP62_04550 [Candidatus Moranbacteria bacterium]|nr:hypothetical protein [Candidatus Moranbacteria bacterium]